jgi:hypothetical protein
VVAATALEVSGFRLPGEDPWSRLVDGPATEGRPLAPRLADLGIRYVVVFPGPGSNDAERSLGGLRPVRAFPDLRLYRVPGPVRIPEFASTPAGPVVAGDVVAVGLVLVAAGALIRSRRRRPTGSHGAGRDAGTGAEPPAMLGRRRTEHGRRTWSSG